MIKLKYEQLTLFDENLKTPEEVERDYILNRLKKDNGMYITLNNYLIFVNEDGTYEDLPHESFAPKHFIVTKPNRKRSMNARKFTSLDEAIKNATQKLSNQTVRSKYLIYAYYDTTKEENKLYRGNTVAESVCYVCKYEDGIKLEGFMNAYSYYANASFLTTEDKKQIQQENKIPSSWIKIRKKNNQVETLETILKEKHNVKDIIYTSNLTIKEKVDRLKRLIEYYKAIDEVFDVYLVPPVKIIIENIRSANADYSSTYNQIRLRVNCFSSFFHEFFHHIDYKAKRPTQKCYDLYREIAQSLLKDKTLVEFDEKYQKRFEEYRNKQNKDSRDRYYYNQSLDYYNYYTKELEIMARFFSDYMYLRNPDRFLIEDRPEYHHYVFTEEEVEKYSSLMDELLSELMSIKELQTCASK